MAKKVGYKDIVETGFKLIKQNTDEIWEICSETRGETFIKISGIVDMMAALLVQVKEDDEKCY